MQFPHSSQRPLMLKFTDSMTKSLIYHAAYVALVSLASSSSPVSLIPHFHPLFSSCNTREPTEPILEWTKLRSEKRKQTSHQWLLISFTGYCDVTLRLILWSQHFYLASLSSSSSLKYVQYEFSKPEGTNKIRSQRSILKHESIGFCSKDLAKYTERASNEDFPVEFSTKGFSSFFLKKNPCCPLVLKTVAPKWNCLLSWMCLFMSA